MKEDTIKTNCAKYDVNYVSPSQSYEERQGMLKSIERERKRRARCNETPAKKKAKQHADKIKKQGERENESPEKAQQRRFNNKIRMRIHREHQSQSEKQHRQKLDKVRKEKVHANESPAKRDQRLAANRDHKRHLRASSKRFEESGSCIACDSDFQNGNVCQCFRPTIKKKFEIIGNGEGSHTIYASAYTDCATYETDTRDIDNIISYADECEKDRKIDDHTFRLDFKHNGYCFDGTKVVRGTKRFPTKDMLSSEIRINGQKFMSINESDQVCAHFISQDLIMITHAFYSGLRCTPWGWEEDMILTANCDVSTRTTDDIFDEIEEHEEKYEGEWNGQELYDLIRSKVPDSVIEFEDILFSEYSMRKGDLLHTIALQQRAKQKQDKVSKICASK